jgi:hypothetical protein
VVPPVVGTGETVDVPADDAGGFCVGPTVLLGWFVVPTPSVELVLSVFDDDEEG